MYRIKFCVALKAKETLHKADIWHYPTGKFIVIA